MGAARLAVADQTSFLRQIHDDAPWLNRTITIGIVGEAHHLIGIDRIGGAEHTFNLFAEVKEFSEHSSGQSIKETGQRKLLFSSVTLTMLPATGLFLPHHAAVQQPSVFDC